MGATGSLSARAGAETVPGSQGQASCPWHPNLIELRRLYMNVRSFSLCLLLACAGIMLSLAASFGWTQANAVTTQSKQKPPASQELFDEIAHMDRALFDAFNARHFDKIKTLFAEDLEFYHDKGGLDSYKKTTEKMKALFEQNNGMRRELVKGSLEVYPIKDYGAIEIGAHTFIHLENGKEVRGTFKFVHIWRKQDSAWKIARAISYAH